eukprot:g17621.t1
MSCQKHPRPEHGNEHEKEKKKKQRCTDSQGFPADYPPGLFSVPLDIWPLVRDLAGAKEVATWNLACKQFHQLVTTDEFWAGFKQPEFNLDFVMHRQILSLFGHVCAYLGHRYTALPLHDIRQPDPRN